MIKEMASKLENEADPSLRKQKKNGKIYLQNFSKADKGFLEEEQIYQGFSRKHCLILPNSRFFIVWDFIAFYFLMYTAIVTP